MGCLATDQRGQARTDGNSDRTVVCDIGAYEAPAGINVVVAQVPALGGGGIAALAVLLAGVGLFAFRRLT
jgi:hypothetical protein